jgi:hypothetical protein
LARIPWTGSAELDTAFNHGGLESKTPKGYFDHLFDGGDGCLYGTDFGVEKSEGRKLLLKGGASMS